MAKYRLKQRVGSHADGTLDKDGRPIVYNWEDDHIWDTDVDMRKKFPGKFELVEITAEDFGKSKPKTSGGKSKGEGADSKTLGENVTKDFALAIEHKFSVFHSPDGFRVTEEEVPGTALNTEPLKSKAAVTKYIKAYIQQ